MNKILFVATFVSLAAAGCTAEQMARMGDSGGKSGIIKPSQIQWQEPPPGLPPGAKAALLEGDPSKAGFFAVRLQMPDGYRIPPHFHPTYERVTVISGTLRLGMGDTFDPMHGESLTAGTYAYMPPGMHHYGWTEGNTVIQIATIGPWGITYLNPADDPRNKK